MISLQETITEENVNEVSEKLAEYTNNTAEIEPEGVESAADVLESIAELNSTDTEVGHYVTTDLYDKIENISVLNGNSTKKTYKKVKMCTPNFHPTMQLCNGADMH